MKKIFDQDEIWFAVLWIAVYVFTFSSADAISESIGFPKLITTLCGLVLSLILWCFIRKHKLQGYYGLCALKGSAGSYLFFIPLILISSVNFWNGITGNLPLWDSVFYILSMCFVAFLEEVIFRGLLFKGMCRENVKLAVLISSLTFGMGHMVNLLLGEPLLETLLQLVYASAIGFCYTAIFLTGGSILPCILSHAVVNATSVVAVQGSPGIQLCTAAVQTVLSVGYGIYLLKTLRRNN